MTALAAAASAERVDALRAEFDSVFAAPPRAERAEWTDLLAITVGAEPYAFRLADLAGLYVDKPVTPLPGAPAAVRGLAGFRGTVVVVYDAAALLGRPRAAECRWMVVTTADAGIALAFSGFDGHARVPTASMTDRAVRIAGAARPVVAVADLLATAALSPGDRIRSTAP